MPWCYCANCCATQCVRRMTRARQGRYQHSAAAATLCCRCAHTCYRCKEPGAPRKQIVPLPYCSQDTMALHHRCFESPCRAASLPRMRSAACTLTGCRGRFQPLASGVGTTASPHAADQVAPVIVNSYIGASSSSAGVFTADALFLARSALCLASAAFLLVAQPASALEPQNQTVASSEALERSSPIGSAPGPGCDLSECLGEVGLVHACRGCAKCCWPQVHALRVCMDFGLCRAPIPCMPMRPSQGPLLASQSNCITATLGMLHRRLAHSSACAMHRGDGKDVHAWAAGWRSAQQLQPVSRQLRQHVQRRRRALRGALEL